MGVSINLPNVEQADVLEFTFEIDGNPVVVPITVAPGTVPGPDELARVAYETEVGLWVQTQDWYQDWVDYATDAYLSAGVGDQVKERFAAQSLLTILGLYQDRMDDLGEAMANRVRFYRPELVQTAPNDPDYTLLLDSAAVDVFLERTKLTDLDRPLVRSVVERTLANLVCWALDQRPENEAHLFNLVADGIRRYGDDATESALWSVLEPGTAEIYRNLNPRLEHLEKVLGFTTGLTVSDLVLPVGAGALGINEGLAAAVDNNWSVTNGLVSYQTPVDGLLVSLTVTEDGVNPITVVQRALDAVERIDPLAARLHTYLSSVAEQQPRPWLDPFTVDTDAIVEGLNLGRLGRVRKSAQVDQVVRSLRSLSQVLVALEWVDDPDYEGSYASLWTIDEYRVRRGRDPVNKLPYRYEIEVRPGHWSRRCLEKDSLRAVYAPTALLNRRDGLGLELIRWYYHTPLTRFTVRDWLVGAKGSITAERVNDRYYRANLHRQFTKALDEVTPDLNPGFDLVDARDWLEAVVTKRVQPVIPVSTEQYVSELQRLRVKAGVSQGELGRLTRHSQAQISRAERDPDKHRDIAAALTAALRKLNKERYSK